MIVKSISVKIDKIKVMKRYTLKVDNGNGVENIWSGNEMSDAIHYETIAKHQFGRMGGAMIWICDNLNELTVG